MNKFLVVANWKANKTVAETKEWCKKWAEYTNFSKDNYDKTQIVLAPHFGLLHFFEESRWDFELASQDISAFPAGAYTGEEPAKLLADLGVKYCLIGHSERRKYLKESNAQVEAKMEKAIQNGIIPILCAQVSEEIPENIRNFSADQYLIMYEPFSAISTDGLYHFENTEKIATTLTDWKMRLNLKCQFLYGGSVNPENIDQLVGKQTSELISGLVVGHASLEVESFSAIIKKCLQNLP